MMTLLDEFSAILARSKKDSDSDLSDYHAEIQRFVNNCCVVNHLVLNIKKTEEIILDFGGEDDHRPVVIHNETISQVSSYILVFVLTAH